MVTKQKDMLSNGIVECANESEIDLQAIFSILLRNKKLVSSITLFGIVFSGLFAISTKKTWQGGFQIVLENTKRELPTSRPGFSSIVGLSSNTSPLKTEVEILKSPSVLMNIFEFVKEKKESSPDSNRKTSFSGWINRLEIELEPSTSVLNITYKDKDKDLVLPVLNRISESYQQYSGKKRLRNLELGSVFFDKQISKYRKKSIDSLREAQQFAIDQDLSLFKDDAKINKDIVNSINIEDIRLRAANEIKVIDNQLSKIKQIEDQSEEIMYFVSSLNIPSLSRVSNLFTEIDFELAEKRLIYQESDFRIQNLLEKRKFLIESLKRQALGYLNANKADAQSRLNASERPEGVLIKYQMLLSKANKDAATLNNLENEYRIHQLEMARSQDPWELITKPTLLPYPVAPKKKTILFFGFLVGFLFGSGVALVKDKRENIIYLKREMELFSNIKVLGEVNLTKQSEKERSVQFLKNGILSEIDGSIGILIISQIDREINSQLDQFFKKVFQEKNFLITNDLIEIKNIDNLILVTILGRTKRDEIIDSKKILSRQKNDLLGMIVVDEINKLD
ncbi:hypothetical protein CL656_05005 [bacterium]|nr:hypothetical protein [bacterium]